MCWSARWGRGRGGRGRAPWGGGGFRPLGDGLESVVDTLVEAGDGATAVFLTPGAGLGPEGSPGHAFVLRVKDGSLFRIEPQEEPDRRVEVVQRPLPDSFVHELTTSEYLAVDGLGRPLRPAAVPS